MGIVLKAVRSLRVSEVVPLSVALPVTAMAILHVWATHCSPVHESTPEPVPGHESTPEPAPVHESAPEPAQALKLVPV